MKNYIPYIAIAILSILFYRQCTLPAPDPQIIIKEKIITVPEQINHFDTITILKPFKTVKIDSTYKHQYLTAKDSLQRLNLYLAAITIQEYNQNFKDSTQSIDVWTRTRGSILGQTVNYKIFEHQITTTDTIELPKARRTLHIGFETSTELDLKASLIYTNRKKTIYSVGVNQDKAIFVGIAIPLFK
jgi:hypothetical protein